MLKLFSKKKTDPAAELENLLGEYGLPSFSPVIMSALEKVRDDECSNGEIAEIATRDPGLSVRLLGTVNSAAFSIRNSVNSVHQAVSLLGRSQLESILVSMAVRESLPDSDAPGYDVQRFWTTSARRATAAAALADRIDPATRSESFTASLLGDMAIPILSHRKPGDYGPILEQHHLGGENLEQLENQAFGWDHARVASWMCAAWKFPDRLASAIGSHHGTGEEDMVALPAVQLVAHLREVEEGDGTDEIIERAYDVYHLPKDESAELIRVSFEESAAVARLFV